MKEQMYQIYTLTDPRTGAVRYVGVTSMTLSQRLSAHLRNSVMQTKTHRSAWLRLLKSLDLKPTITLIEETTDRNRETFWIKTYRDTGADLTNATDGGEGAINIPAEARARIGAASRSRVWTPEMRAKLSASLKGRTMTEDQKERLRSVNLGRKRGPHTPEVLEKMRRAALGHVVSDETREKISKSLTGRPTGRRRSHCPKGHEYTAGNTFINVRGSQECKTCLQERSRSRYLKQKAGGSNEAD